MGLPTSDERVRELKQKTLRRRPFMLSVLRECEQCSTNYSGGTSRGIGMSLICKVVVCFLVTSTAIAQSQGFTKITIGPSSSADPGNMRLKTEGWLPMRLPPPPRDASPDVNHFTGLPTIFTVLKKLGLELHRQEGILPVYTVERIERPATN